ncbi:MAG: GTPase HflX [Rubrobacteraceae bacterium]
MNNGVFERAILVGAGDGRRLDELARLADTLGLSVTGKLEQNRRDGSGYLGKGKREELSQLFKDSQADCIIADDELTASQARVLEKSSGPVVDRTELIIRIFESHARDSASRLQVELAELEYSLPRVKGYNTYFSRLGGGGSTTRGPGEQQIEYDRRTIRRRVGIVKRKIREEEKSRDVRNSRLKKQGPPGVALVGYTNAGKTTILNALSGSGRSTKNRLFETLETATRVVQRDPQKPEFVVTDTVGFISKLPTQLVHSFASTLESATEADILVLCADASSADLKQEIQTVKETLADTIDKDQEDSIILCLNKTDLLTTHQKAGLAREYPRAIALSAVENITPLEESIYSKISDSGLEMDLLIPHSDYGIATSLYGQADIHNKKVLENGVLLKVTIPKNLSDKYQVYRVA